MIATRSKLLGGEGCPVADISKPAQNRNIRDVLLVRGMQARAGSSRTLQEQTGEAGTPLAQQTEFRIALCSDFKAWLDRQNLTEDGAEAANDIIRYLKLTDMPAALIAGLADAVQRLATAIRSTHEGSAEPVVIVSIGQSERRQQIAAGGIAPPAGR